MYQDSGSKGLSDRTLQSTSQISDIRLQKHVPYRIFCNNTSSAGLANLQHPSRGVTQMIAK